MKRTTIILPEQLRRQAKNYAKAHRMTLAQLVREALVERMKRAAVRDPIFECTPFKGGGKHGSTEKLILYPDD